MLRSPRARHAGCGIDDDVLIADEASGEERVEPQDRASGVAARVGNETRAPNRVTGDLRQPVDCFGQQFRGRLLPPVVPLVDGGILDPEVPREVDDLRPEVQGGCRVRHGEAVRLSHEDDIRASGREVHVLGLADQIGPSSEPWTGLVQPRALVGVGPYPDKLRARMPEDVRRYTGAGVARRPHHSNPDVTGASGHCHRLRCPSASIRRTESR